jgi:hypothetical protein
VFKVSIFEETHEFRFGALQKDFSANKIILKIFLSVFVYALSSRTTRAENIFCTKKIFYFFFPNLVQISFSLSSRSQSSFFSEKTNSSVAQLSQRGSGATSS